jgi:ATP-dependent Zn protease
MVTEYGMGTELQSKQLPADDYSMSDATRRMVDEEQQYITDLAHRRAGKLLSENRTLLEGFAFTLLDKEVLEREDIDSLMAGYEAASDDGRVFARERAGEVKVAAAKRVDPA